MLSCNENDNYFQKSETATKWRHNKFFNFVLFDFMVKSFLSLVTLLFDNWYYEKFSLR